MLAYIEMQSYLDEKEFFLLLKIADDSYFVASMKNVYCNLNPLFSWKK